MRILNHTEVGQTSISRKDGHSPEKNHVHTTPAFNSIDCTRPPTADSELDRSVVMPDIDYGTRTHLSPVVRDECDMILDESRCRKAGHRHVLVAKGAVQVGASDKHQRPLNWNLSPTNEQATIRPCFEIL